MRHLGERVTAFVDGQLGGNAREQTLAHLARCEPCRKDVAAERAMKDALRGLSQVGPPAGLVDELHTIAGPGGPVPPRRRPFPAVTASAWDVPASSAAPWASVPAVPGQRGPVRAVAGVVVSIAVLTVLLAGIGATETPAAAEAVVPEFDRYAFEHTGAFPGPRPVAGESTRVEPAGRHMPDSAGAIAPAWAEPAHRLAERELADLRASGWTCPEELASGLALDQAKRVGSAVQLQYTDGAARVSVFEQPGRLDTSAIDGFTVHGSGDGVYYRGPGEPARYVWQTRGFVVTVLVDAPSTADTVLAAMPPAGDESSGFLARVGRGAQRLMSWVNPFD